MRGSKRRHLGRCQVRPLTLELARNSAKVKIGAAIAKSRAQVKALVGAIEVSEAPTMPEPTEVLSRKRKSRTTKGAIVSSDEYRKDLRGTIEERGAEVAAKKAKGEGRTRKFSLKWAPLVEKERGHPRRGVCRADCRRILFQDFGAATPPGASRIYQGSNNLLTKRTSSPWRLYSRASENTFNIEEQ